MGRKHISLAVIAAVTIALLFLVDSTGYLLADGDDEKTTVLPASRQDSGAPLSLASGEFVTLTLITGERVRATGNGKGELNVERLSLIGGSGDDGLNSARSTPAVQPQMSEKLDPTLLNVEYLVSERFHERPELPVIVTTADVSSLASVEGLVTSLGGTVTWTSENLMVVAATLSYEDIGAVSSALTSTDFVEKIWLDAILRVALDQSLPIIDVPILHAQGNQGEGVIIAVLDTGVDSTHPDLDDIDDDPTTFDPKVVYTFNHTNETETVEDLMGHGTHVAGIAAGTGKTSHEVNPTGPHYIGVAPKAFLWNIKVLNKDGSGSVVQIAQGLERTSLGPDGVPRSGDEPDVINLSVGNQFNGDGTDPMSRAVDFAVDQGVTVAVAAGNWGPELSSVGQPAVSKRGITVGATTKSDEIVSFSSRGPTTDRRLKPDVVAPGAGIISTCATQGNYNCRFAGDRYTTLSGTSMATPHVAGTAALILEKHPDWTPEQVKSALMNTAHDMGVSLREQGAGRIHAPSAVDTSLLVWEPSVSFGLVTLNQSRTQTISIENLTDNLVSVQATASTSLSGIPSDLVTVSPSTFNIPAGGTANVTLDLGPVDSQSPQGWYEGRVRIGSAVGEIFVPYLFFVSQPSEIEVTPDVFDQIPVHQLKQTSRTLNIVNSGSGPVGFGILEDATNGGSTASGEPVFVQTLGDEAVSVFSQGLPTIVDDPAADNLTSPGSAKVDLLRIGAKSNNQFLALQLGFSEDTQTAEVRGKIFLDTDQDPSTGRPPTFKGGLPSQDIGYEYYLDLEDVLAQNQVKVFDKNDNLRGMAPGQVIGQSIAITVPTSVIGDDDGSVDVVAIFSNLNEPTDWAPDEGHGVLLDSDVPWISFTPPYGTVEPDTTSQVTVTFDARFAPVGSHTATILIGNNDPGSLVTVVPAILNVEQGQNANIHVGPTSLSANLVSGDVLAESFTVSNFGNGVLSIVLSDEDLATGLDATWLSLEPQTTLVDPASGTVDVQAVVDATGLPTGTYDAEITVEHNDPIRGAIIVSATLDVSAPEMTLSSNEFQIGQEPGQVSTHTLTIGNVGSGTLNFEIEDVLYLDPGPTGVSPTGPPKVAVFEDTLPWDRTVLHDVLSGLALDLDLYTSSDMGTVSLVPYSKVIVSSAQSQQFYTNLTANSAWFEQYVMDGGVLQMHLDADGRLHLRPGLPGGFVLSNASPFLDVRILQPDHPAFVSPNSISDAELSFWNPSAKSYFVDMPEGADVLAEWESTQRPIAAEYKMGKGRILVTTQFLEHLYGSEPFLENLLNYRASGTPWLAIEPDSSSVAPGSQIDVTLTIDSDELDGGLHRASLQLSTNDPVALQTVVPFFLSIIGPPSLVSPADVTKSPDRDWTLKWLVVPSVTEYVLEVDRVQTFDSIDLIQVTTADPQHDINLDQPGPYYWRVKGEVSGSVETSWSETRRFTLVDPLVRVSSNVAPDKNPALLQLANGNLITVWSSGDDLWSSFSLDGGKTWSDRQPVTADSVGASGADLHQAADGTLWLTYWAWDGPNADVWARTSLDDGTTWSDQMRICEDPAGDFDPSITQTPNGTIWLVWPSRRNGIDEIWYRTSVDNGQSWSNSAILSLDGGAKTYPDVTAVADGSLLLTWQECDAFCRIMFARSADGVFWSAPVAVSDDKFDNRWPTIAVTPDENIWIAWTVWHNDNPNIVWNWDVLYTLSPDGGTTWIDEQQFTTHAGPDERPEIARLSELGTIGVAWHSQRAGNPDVWFGVVDHLEDVLVPPVVSNIAHRPAPNPEAGDIVTITARITDQDAVQSATVVWSIDGAEQSPTAMFDDGTNGDAIATDGDFTAQIGPFQAGSSITYQIQAANIYDIFVVFPTEPELFEVQQPFQPTTDILLVVDSNQDDQVALVAPFYIAAIDSIGAASDFWDVSKRGTVRPEVLSVYTDGIVIWGMPFCCGVLATSETQFHLKTYLESGGKLFLSGQDAAQELQSTDLLRQTLGTIFVRPSTGTTRLNGVDADPVGDRLVLEAHGGDGANNQVSLDEVAPLMEHATPSFTYDAGGGSVAIPIGGIRAETETYKAVLLSFGFESINSALMRTKVLRRIVNWLTTTVDNQVHVSPIVARAAKAGETLSVVIQADVIDGMRHADVLVAYDRSILSVQAAQVAQALGTNCHQESFSILPEGLRLRLSCTDDEAGAPLPLWQVDFQVANLDAPITTTLQVVEVALANGDEPPDPIFGYGGAVLVDVSLGECGDLNDDGEVTIQDAIASLQHVTGRIELTGRQRFLADVVPNGVLDILDVIFLLQHLVGVVVLDECGQV